MGRQSPTLFVQQLGRGLRQAPGKAFCTVLDFVGLHRREFRFDRRLRALLGGTRRDVERAVELRFPFLPAGCLMQLDEKASEIVLRSLREAIPSRWPARVEELRSLRRERPGLDLAGFLEDAGLALDDVYDGRRGWSDLLEAAGAPIGAPGPHERALRRAAGRLLHIDDEERIDTYLRLLDAQAVPSVDALPERRRRLVRMLVAAVAEDALSKGATVQDAVDVLWRHPQVRAELIELLSVLRQTIGHVHLGLSGHPDVPLQVHARYSRLEILAAMGVGTGAKPAAWQSGVWEAKEANAELLAFTLDKSGGLRHQPHPYPLGEPVDHARGQPHGTPVPPSRPRRTIDPALHASSNRRPRVLVPRSGEVPWARRREADGDHLGARPPPSGRSVCGLRGGGRLIATAAPSVFRDPW
jgi:hypothetical protein